MKNAVLIDTDILIDAGRGNIEAIARLLDIETAFVLAISVITKMEMIAGCRDKGELALLNMFLRRYATICIDEQVSETALNLFTQFRLSHNLHIPDALIAATAIANDMPLLSKNQKDFRFINQLRLLPFP